MKLRNKKTGEILDLGSLIIKNPNRINCESIINYDSLSELNEEWEDYEEPDLVPNQIFLKGSRVCIDYNSVEAAEKALEKLKAWKRLKDNGFRFEGWERDERYCGDFVIKATDQTSCDNKDLGLLFRGEE